MSYDKLIKTPEEFDEIFSAKSEISKVRDFKNKNLNLILSSQNIVGTLKPILENILVKQVDNLKVALIPNAGLGDEYKRNGYDYLEQFTILNNMYIKLLDLERWPKNLILESLESCDIISISGGLASRMLKSLDKVGIRKELIELVEAGKPLIGFSAGAMCLSETVNFARNYIGEPDPDIDKIKPLGLVDFEVYPHFEDVMLPSLEAMLPTGNHIEAYGLKPTEAMIVTKGELLQAGNPVRVNAFPFENFDKINR